MMRFRKLLETKPLDGATAFAVVTYTRHPYLQKTSDIFVPTSNHDVNDRKTESYIAQYEKRLTIDLWLCVLRFSWLTKEQEAGDE